MGELIITTEGRPAINVALECEIDGCGVSTIYLRSANGRHRIWNNYVTMGHFNDGPQLAQAKVDEFASLLGLDERPPHRVGIDV